MKGAIGGVLVGVMLAGAIVACGGAPQAPKMPERDEILTLWTQIRDWRMRAGLRVDPDLPQMQGGQLKKYPVCPADQPVPKTCDDVCSLKDAICDNSERICDLAKKLGPDDRFAADKCKSSKDSCTESKGRCCECSIEPEQFQ